MPNDALAKIRRAAVKIRNKKGGSYQRALKEAGKMYREGKISGARSTRPKKGSSHKSRSHSRSKSKRVSGGGVVTISGLKNTGLNQQLEKSRDQVHEELGWMLAAQRTARTKKEKRELQPKIDRLTKLLRSLQGE